MDFISQLPDEILVLILVRTKNNTAFAVRTSILSKRWRNIYKLVPSVTLSCNDFVWNCPHVSYLEMPHGWYWYSDHIICKMDEFFSLYSGFKMPSIFLQCCFPWSNRLESFFFKLGKLGVEHLSVFVSCIELKKCPPFSFPNLHPCLRIFLLNGCILQPTWKGQCNSSLQTLHLSHVELRPGSLECVLLNCLRVNTLKIDGCKSPTKLCFHGPDLQLKTLIIKDCLGLKDVDLHASNLITLEVYYRDEIHFIFAHVPQLQKFYLAAHTGKMKISRVFSGLSEDLPQLKYLILGPCDSYQGSMLIDRTVIGTFRNLRRLDLIYVWRCNLAPYLENCPLLQELRVAVVEYHSLHDGATRREDVVVHSEMKVEISAFEGEKLRVAGYHSLHDGATRREDVVVHSELKKVEISAFEGKEDQIEFCLYLLKSAVRLEEMLLCRCRRAYFTDDRWTMFRSSPWSRETYEMIVRRLQHQAVSPIAQLKIKSYAPP